MKRLLHALGSLRLSVGGMLLLALVILYDRQISALHIGWLAACLGLLALNLAAAVIVRPQFRRQAGLLVFHLCLMSVAGLAALEVLTSFQGRIELAEKQPFSPDGTEVLQQGPWHINRLQDIQFVQGPVRVDYRPNLRRGRTQTEVFYVNEGQMASMVFGDTRAFRDRGYRFVTTPNKGYALTLSWLGEDESSATGNIHMPSFPIREWDQSKHWLSPAGEELTLELENLPVSATGSWTLSSQDFNGRVFVRRQDGIKIELQPGVAIDLTGGQLKLDEVVLWIGYRIESNAVLPWLFVSAALGTIALGWHFWRNPPVFRAAGNDCEHSFVT